MHPDPFIIPRQACRCGERFATLEAHLVHADYGEPLPHDDPAALGLHRVAGPLGLEEWTHKLPEVVTDLRKSAVAPPRKRAPKGQGKPYVPAAERPAHEFDRTCTECGTIFQRPRKRGRPPTKCPTCRGVA